MTDMPGMAQCWRSLPVEYRHGLFFYSVLFVARSFPLFDFLLPALLVSAALLLLFPV